MNWLLKCSRLKKEKGEVALTLSLLGLLIGIVGLSVGVVSIQQQQSRSASADELFTYKSTLELRDENGNVIDWESGMTWNNGLGGATRSSGDIKMPDSSKARLIYDATKSPGVPANVQNVEAHVTIGLPDGWTILDASCENKKGKTCDNVRWGTRDGGTDDHTMYGFKIADGAEVLYWFKVRRPGGTPPTTPDPAQICKSVGQACTDDYPEACTTASGQAGTRTCHKVGTCTGVGNGTQCSWGAGSSCTKCEASGGGGSLSCSRPCIYSQGDKCYKGRCDANNPTCKDGIANANNGCRFAGNECGVPATQVRCSDGGPIIPTPSVGKPKLTVQVNFEGLVQAKPVSYQLRVDEIHTGDHIFIPAYTTIQPATTRVTRTDTHVVTTLSAGKYYRVGFQMGDEVMEASQVNCDSNVVTDDCDFRLNPGEQRTITMNLTTSYSPTLTPMLTVTPSVTVSPSPSPSTVTPSASPEPEPPSGTPTPPPAKPCRVLKTNEGATETVVFLPVGFSTTDNAAEAEKYIQVLDFVNDIDKTNLKDRANRFNYVMYTNVGIDGSYGCKKQGTNLHSCKALHPEAIETAQACDGTIRVIVVNQFDNWALHNGGYSNGYGTKSVVIYQYSPPLLAHEFGHALPGLLDEYWGDNAQDADDLAITTYYNTNASINCSGLNSDGKCKWGDSNGCIEGCDHKKGKIYRSSENSVMKDTFLDGGADFNQLSLTAWNKYFDNSLSINSLVAQENFEYKNSLYIQLAQPAPGSLRLLSTSTKPTYPQLNAPVFSRLTDKYYTLTLIGSDNSELFSTEITQYSDNPHDDKGPQLISEHYLYLPYFDNASRVDITNAQGGVVLSINLAEQNLAPPIPAGNQCGNGVCDGALGETANSCRMDCGEHLQKTEAERADLDANKVVNGADLSVIMDDAVYQVSSAGDVDGDLKTNALDYTLVLKWLGTERK